MKFTILICLLVAALVSTSYGDAGNGVIIQSEAPVQLSKCPAYDDPNHLVMLHYPNDCRKYYACINGLGYVHQCPDNLYWSQLTYRCDIRSYSECQNNEIPDVAQYPTQYNAFPGDCSHYYETRLLSCPDNYHWNVRYQRCDLPQLAGCDSSPIALPPYTTQIPFVPTAATPPSVPRPTMAPGTNAPIDPDNLCRNAVQNAYLPYPGDCHKFIHCGPSATVITCATGLYWNRNTQSCSLTNTGCL